MIMATPSVLLFFLIACFLLTNDIAEASHIIYPQLQSVAPRMAVNRTGFHFQPSKNWINDPNAPMYYKGYYHFFYQYNTDGVVWGNIVWGHSVSKDLINWIAVKNAIYPSKPFDIEGAWSGSATMLAGNRPAIMYTGLDTLSRQVQNIAFPKNLSDPFLREWVKPDFNPIISNEVNISKFRDPTTAWFNNGHWKLLVGSVRGTRGLVYLYRSRNFIKWTKAQHPLHSSPQTGMWECPDFFPVSLKGKQGLDWSTFGNQVKHVLKVSLDVTRFEYYTIGTYFPEKDRYVPDNTSTDDSSGLRFDYGNFYASKTFLDKKNNRRILWGWANESDTVEQDLKKGWAGIQLIPRTIWLDKRGRQLILWPVKELENLRENKVCMTNVPLAKGEHVEVHGINADQADVEVTFDVPNLHNAEIFDPNWVDAETLCSQKSASVEGGVGPFGLKTLASKNLEEYTAISFQIFKAKENHVVLMCSGGNMSSLSPKVWKPSYGGFVEVDLDDGKLSLRSLIDHSVVESFGAEGKTCITSRVYPTLVDENNVHLHMFNNGLETVTMRELNAWNMKTAIRDDSLLN